MEEDSKGSSSKLAECEDKPEPMIMLFLNLCVPSGHCCIDSTAYSDVRPNCNVD